MSMRRSSLRRHTQCVRPGASACGGRDKNTPQIFPVESLAMTASLTSPYALVGEPKPTQEAHSKPRVFAVEPVVAKAPKPAAKTVAAKGVIITPVIAEVPKLPDVPAMAGD